MMLADGETRESQPIPETRIGWINIPILKSI
jgi:hypothetical protein